VSTPGPPLAAGARTGYPRKGDKVVISCGSEREGGTGGDCEYSCRPLGRRPKTPLQKEGVRIETRIIKGGGGGWGGVWGGGGGGGGGWGGGGGGWGDKKSKGILGEPQREEDLSRERDFPLRQETKGDSRTSAASNRARAPGRTKSR